MTAFVYSMCLSVALALIWGIVNISFGDSFLDKKDGVKLVVIAIMTWISFYKRFSKA